MDDLTVTYYNDNSKILQNKYNSFTPDYIHLFQRYYDTGSTVLDIGCGSGRDLNILIHLGFDAYGLERSKNMINSSLDHYSINAKRVHLGSIPDDLSKVSSKIWDNILVAAVLQHIPDSMLFESLFSMHKLLKNEGTLIISVPTVYPNIKKNRDLSGRLFILRSKVEYLHLLERIGFTLLYKQINDDAQSRDNTTWTTLVLKK